MKLLIAGVNRRRRLVNNNKRQLQQQQRRRRQLTTDSFYLFIENISPGMPSSGSKSWSVKWEPKRATVKLEYKDE